jgi:hypothetical protein
MGKFSWQTMLIFVVSLLLAVVLLGLGIAHIINLKQQRRQLSDNGVFDCADVKPRPQPTTCAWSSWGSAGFSPSLADFSSCIPAPLPRGSSDADEASWNPPSQCLHPQQCRIPSEAARITPVPS